MKTVAALVLFASAATAHAQTPLLSVNSRIKLPSKDIEGVSLVSSLDHLLSSLQLSVEENEWIYPPQRCYPSSNVVNAGGSQGTLCRGGALHLTGG